MTQTLPPPQPLPPPLPALWAPKTRHGLMKALGWLDRRKASHGRLQTALKADAQWREDYLAWFIAYGWQQGAAHPADAWAQVIRSRRPPAQP